MHVRFCTFVLVLAAAVPAFADMAHTGSRADAISGECSGFEPSFGLERQTESLGIDGGALLAHIYGHGFEDTPLLLWTDLFDVPFPARSSQRSLRIENGKFVALQFDPGAHDDPRYGGVDTGSIQQGLPGGFPTPMVWSISRCPGDFSPPPDLPAFCRTDTASTTLNWQVTGGEPSDFTCQLFEHTTYYFNLAFVDVSTGANTCMDADARCTVALEAR